MGYRDKDDAREERQTNMRAVARWVVSGGGDGTVRVWPLTADDMTAAACARLRPSLERDASAKYLADLAKTLGHGIQPCP